MFKKFLKVKMTLDMMLVKMNMSICSKLELLILLRLQELRLKMLHQFQAYCLQLKLLLQNNQKNMIIHQCQAVLLIWAWAAWATGGG